MPDRQSFDRCADILVHDSTAPARDPAPRLSDPASLVRVLSEDGLARRARSSRDVCSRAILGFLLSVHGGDLAYHEASPACAVCAGDHRKGVLPRFHRRTVEEIARGSVSTVAETRRMAIRPRAGRVYHGIRSDATDRAVAPVIDFRETNPIGISQEPMLELRRQFSWTDPPNRALRAPFPRMIRRLLLRGRAAGRRHRAR
jgi:hypothetical protein